MRLSDLNIENYEVVIPPSALKSELPLPDAARQLVNDTRQTVKNILDGQDKRLFVVVGPCSIHDPALALEYARRLKQLSEQLYANRD